VLILKKYINWPIAIILSMILGVNAGTSHSYAGGCSDGEVTYMIQEGDHLYGIGTRFGDFRFWEAIYIANADQIQDPDIIYPDQELRIPYHIGRYTDSSMSRRDVLKNPFCDVSVMPIREAIYGYLFLHRTLLMQGIREMARRDSDLANLIIKRDGTGYRDEATEIVAGLDDDEAVLMAFREAFEQNLREEAERQELEERTQETELQVFTEVDGMIHDETRSKAGRDFYDMFYSFWQTPPGATNYSIRILEQPAPSMGTIVTVMVNDIETFQTRLQPRYEYIEEAGQFAVRRTYLYLRDNQQQFLIY